MKLLHKLILGFLIVALMVGAVGGASLYQLLKIAKIWHNDMPAIIKVIKTTSHLDGLAQFIRYYDEVLTQSARNYAFTQDNKWKKRYKDIEPELDTIIKEAIKKGDEKDRDFFLSVNSANIALVRMEYKSIEFVDNGDNEEAIGILNSREYWRQKNIYEKGLKNYVNKRGIQYNEVLETSTEKINSLHDYTEVLFNESKRFVFILVIISVIMAIGVGALIYYSISKPLRELKVAAARIGNGELTFSLEVHSKDELGELASSFNKMAKDLQTITASRDELNKEIDERKKMENQLKTLSLTDELTGLYNRRGFFNLAEQQLKLAKRKKEKVFLLYLDLNGLKEINDNFGHNEGDKALKDVARALKSSYRESNIIGRLGGDEFVVFPVGSDDEAVKIVVDRLLKNIDIHNKKSNKSYELSVSVGVAYYDPKNPSSLDELITKADRIMYGTRKRTML